MGVSPAFLLNATDGVGQGAGGRGAVGTGGRDKNEKVHFFLEKMEHSRGDGGLDCREVRCGMKAWMEEGRWAS